jgi:ferric-dicitrate binding protein FerR (iron transport regulator)
MERKLFKNLTEEERKNLKRNIYERLGLPHQHDTPAPASRKTLWMAAVAASLLIIAGLLVFRADDRLQEDDTIILLASTKPGEIKQVTLRDSSVVILNPSSSLYGKNNSDGGREVFLAGNGFFKVKHLTSNRPFVVHANAVNVTVLGTQFNVNTRSPDVEVALTSGKVKLDRNNGDAHAEFLAPGEKMIATDSSFEKLPIDISMYSAWTKGEWNFKNTSLGEIAKLIGDYYAVEVIFSNKRTRDLRMTAVMPVNGLPALIQVIRETLPVDLTLKNSQLYIQ